MMKLNFESLLLYFCVSVASSLPLVPVKLLEYTILKLRAF